MYWCISHHQYVEPKVRSKLWDQRRCKIVKLNLTLLRYRFKFCEPPHESAQTNLLVHMSGHTPLTCPSAFPTHYCECNENNQQVHLDSKPCTRISFRPCSHPGN